MTKVMLPREITEAIDELKKDCWSDYSIISLLDDDELHAYNPSLVTLSKYFNGTELSSMAHPNFLMKALVNGYDAIPTPEESILKYYKDQLNLHESIIRDDQVAAKAAKNAIEFVLEELNVKIDGIN